MRPLLLCSLLALLMPTAHAEPNRYVSLDGETVPPPPSYYKAEWESEVVTVGANPCLQLFPSGKKPSHGTVIIAPGGGYENLSTSKEGSNIAAVLNEEGWDAAVLIYTVGKKEDKDAVKKQALAESEKVLALVQKRGGELGLSGKQVGLMGLSAGGHLAIRTAHETSAANPPDFLVLIYPAYLQKDGQLLPDVVPPNVPIFLFVGDKDGLTLDDARTLHKHCREQGMQCDFTIAPGVGHGFGITKNLPEGARDWPDKLKTFLASLPAPKAAAQP